MPMVFHNSLLDAVICGKSTNMSMECCRNLAAAAWQGRSGTSKGQVWPMPQDTEIPSEHW